MTQTMTMNDNNRIKISQIVGEPHLKHFNDKKTLHQIDKGGRASTKSSKNEVKIPFLFLDDPTAEAVVVRKVYKDHRDTSYAGLKIGFSRLKWKLEPHINHPAGKQSTMWLQTNQGNYVHFVGLNDYESTKGARPTKPENKIKILWLFEITQFSDEQEMNNIISNYIRGKKDWFIIMYEFNPHPKKSHWTYEWLEKMEKRVGRDTYIQHTNYCDLPEWQQKEWLGDILLQEIEELKRIDYEQFKSIYLGLPANISGTVYKSFYEQKHVKNLDKNPNRYAKFIVGVDYGETDATTFTLLGILQGYKGARVLKTYYHRNGHDPEDKGIEQYSDDFFEFMAEYWLEYNRPCKVFVDSAAKHFWSYLKREKARKGIGRFQILPTPKGKKLKIFKDADELEERIALTNIMFSSGFLEIDISCKNLVKAFSESERDKRGRRRDDGTTDIDSIDSFEYTMLTEMQMFLNAILRKRGYLKKEDNEDWNNLLTI